MTRPEAAAKAHVAAPDLAPVSLAKPKLMSVADAKAMTVATMADEFMAHINPGQMHFMKLLSFNKVKVESADDIAREGTQACDVYAFGLLAWEVLTGGVAFAGIRREFARQPAIVQLLVREGADDPAPHDDIPVAWRDIVTRCWAADAAARPTMAEVLASPLCQ